jgi:hypothetical protein
MDVFLLRAIRIVIRADSDPVRQALFANLTQSSLPARLVYGLHERLASPSLSALLVSGYGAAFFLTIAPDRNRRAPILIVARHANARRQVHRVASWVGRERCGWVNTGMKGLLGPYAFARRTFRRFVTAFRIIRRVDMAHGFLVSCRVAGALAWYARATAILAVRRPDAVLVSSDSNPEELGFASAARARRIPTVFISHAYPTPLSPVLDFSLSILEGEAEVQARSRKGPIRGRVVFAGLEGDSAPLDASRFERANPIVGIFTPKAVSWPALSAIIADCRQHLHARQIIIRWHPSMIEPPGLGHVLGDLSGVVESSPRATVWEVAAQCDWVIADENSGVHLPVLKLGIPTVAVKHLGLYPDSRSDLYGFAANNIVFPPVASIRDVRADALAAFFSGQWPARFQKYDAAYLRPETVIGGEVQRAIWQLFESPSSKATCA